MQPRRCHITYALSFIHSTHTPPTLQKHWIYRPLKVCTLLNLKMLETSPRTSQSQAMVYKIKRNISITVLNLKTK